MAEVQVRPYALSARPEVLANAWIATTFSLFAMGAMLVD
jgi:hypothetical protein